MSGSALSADLTDRIAAGKVLAARAEPYLAAALHALTVRAASGPGTCAVDRWWRLHVDADATVQWTPAQWGTVLRAETRRLLLGHPDRADRCSDRIPSGVFALASDAVVNSDTHRGGNVDWPRPAPRTEDYPGGHAGMAVEEVADLLRIQEVPPPDACGSGACGARQPWEQPDPAEDARTIGQAQSDLLRRQVAKQISEHGNATPGLELWAGDLLEPRVDWRAALDGHVRAATAKAAGRRDYTYSRPSRRSAPAGPGGRAILPGMYAPEPPRVTVIRDTSGSMTGTGRDLVAEAAGEIDGMLRARARVTVIDTDSETHAAQRLQGSAAQLTATGGGSTDMGVGLDAAAMQRPRPHLAVVLTDGMTPWPERNPLAGTPVLVCLLGEHGRREAENVPAWARTVIIDDAAR